MASSVITRERIILVALAIILGFGGTFWFSQADRQLRRTWNGLLDTVEARNTRRLGQVLADDYQDRWGYTRQSILDDARLAFFQFRHLELTAEQVRIERDGDRATVTAIMRIAAEGGGQVNDARATVNALFTPFVFTWRREPGLMGAWKLVRFDHPELELARFRSRW